jgi:ribosomal protein S12 methylthiotransferase accessory factor
VTASAALERLVSPYTGIVREVSGFLYATDEPRLAKVGAAATGGSALLGVDLGHLEGASGGSAVSVAEARAAALGEAAERYSASYVPHDELVLASACALRPEAVAPECFALFHERQLARPGFPFVPFSSQTRVRWVRGFRVDDRSPAYVPAQFVYLAWRDLVEDEAHVAYSTSSGLACGETLEDALLRALLELVERDAFMLTWSNRLSLPRLVWRGDEDLRELERRHFLPTGLAYDVVDLSSFLDVPTALAIVRDEGRRGPVGVGAASAARVGDAWRKALAEAFSVRSWAAALDAGALGSEFAPDFSDVVSFADHVRFHADPRRAACAAFLGASPSERDVSSVASLPGTSTAERLDAVLERLAAAGVDAYAVDVTAPDVREAGLHVVKAICPQLCALDVAHAARFLGGERILRAAYEAGLAPAPLVFDELNPYPHPFP